MNFKKIFSVILLVISIASIYAFTSGAGKKVSLHMKSRIAAKGSMVVSEADIYYNFEQGKMTMKYEKPFEYYVLSNNRGETKMYYPSKNEVYLNNNPLFSTEKNLLYYFLSNKTYDLGLKDMGYSLFKTRYEEGHMISTWKPVQAGSSIAEVELVHKNYLPIFIAYYDEKGKLLQKIFYYDYTLVNGLNFPSKVVEISYLGIQDSSVTKIEYSDILFGENENNKSFFEFKVPQNAKLVE